MNNRHEVLFEMITFAHGSVDKTGQNLTSDHCYVITKEAMTSDAAKRLIKLLDKQKVKSVE